MQRHCIHNYASENNTVLSLTHAEPAAEINAAGPADQVKWRFPLRLTPGFPGTLTALFSSKSNGSSCSTI
jgi:hypothetical protein